MNQTNYVPRTTFVNGISPWPTAKDVEGKKVARSYPDSYRAMAAKRGQNEITYIYGDTTIKIYSYILRNPAVCCVEIANATGLRKQTVEMQLRHWVISRHVVREKFISSVSERRCWHYSVNENKIIVISDKRVLSTNNKRGKDGKFGS